MEKPLAISVLRRAGAGLALAALACASSAPKPEPAPAAAAAPAAPAPPAAPGAPTADALDQQAQQLAAIPGAQVGRKSGAVTIRFPAAELFDPDSTELSAAGQERMRALARALTGDPTERIIVRGHSDGRSDPGASQAVSEDLADSVRNFLVAEGVVPSRITAVGLAASQPLAANADGRQENRRVEIELWPDDDARR